MTHCQLLFYGLKYFFGNMLWGSFCRDVSLFSIFCGDGQHAAERSLNVVYLCINVSVFLISLSKCFFPLSPGKLIGVIADRMERAHSEKEGGTGGSLKCPWPPVPDTISRVPPCTHTCLSVSSSLVEPYRSIDQHNKEREIHRQNKHI